MVIGKRTSTRIGGLLLLFFWVSPLVQLVAQDESDVDSTGQCQPAELQTVYDTRNSGSATMEELNIAYDYAREYMKYSDYQRAVPYLWSIITRDKQGTFKVAYGKLVESYLQLNQTDSALIVAYRGLQNYPDYAILHYHVGQIHKSLGQIECAIPQYEELIRLTPEGSAAARDYWSILAHLYFQIQDERALEAQKKLIELDPNNAEASNLLVQMMQFFGKDPLEAMKQAFLNDTTNVANAFRFGKEAYDAGEYKEALRAFKAILKQTPKNAEALNYLGRSYEGLDRITEAIDLYKKAVQIAPDNLSIICSIASAYARLNQFSEARNYAQRALAKNPRFGLAYMVMGSIYENAVSYCSNQRQQKGFTYEDKLVYEKAREQYLLAAQKDPNVASAANTRAQQLQPFVRTVEDIHMHNDSRQIKDPCYNWIQ